MKAKIYQYFNILDDHSRVKLLPLDDEEGSDYINANFIPVNITWKKTYYIDSHYINIYIMFTVNSCCKIKAITID